MRKALLLTLLLGLFATLGFSQVSRTWTPRLSSSNLITDKAVARVAYPKVFKLFDLDVEPLRQQLFSVTDNSRAHSTIISLPNADGNMEEFEVYEASNFAPELQARFPEIRAFSGKGITDKGAYLKLSYSPQGIQTMILRSGNATEFMEPYSADHKVYSVYRSQRNKGGLPWSCSTEDQNTYNRITENLPSSNLSSAGELKTMRLAQSCNGEYANYFGATSSAQVGLVLAGMNATLTRCNGCYEKDLALHLNLIPNTDLVIFYNPATDPYTTLGAWNGQLQTTLTNIIGEANYDIGHMFGASGGGGNAGCIGCVCVDGMKGRGITSPADGIPQGDNFDIDYVAHEVGHQLGGNHTFSQSLEGTGVNKEVGSGITIMGYAGITSQDVAPHSIDIFHQASIQQIQTNLAGKTCPITTNITAVNATPVVAPHPNYTIPMSTPFELTGVATDANPGDILTYCWEQNDNSTTTGNASVASPTKLTGPNFLTFPATVSPTRYFPRLQTILAGLFVTPTLGGDAIANTEALSSVARTLNFRLTVRDNSPYSSTAPIKVGQTAFTDMVVTVTTTSGPFMVTSPNTNVSWGGGTTQTITWDVANSTAAPVSTANVKIMYSTDGGLTFPTTLVASTTNDGSETVTIPVGATTTARIKVMAVGNIFFDISNTNFTVTAPPTGFDLVAPAASTLACPAPAAPTVTLNTNSNGGFSTPITLTATAGVPAGTTVGFSANPVTPGSSSVITLNNANTLSNGTYNITITGVAGAITQTTTVSFIVSAGTGPSFTTAPVNTTVCAGSNATFTTAATGATSYQWQVSTDGGANYTNIAAATGTNYTVTAATAAMNNYRYRIIGTGQCGTTTTTAGILTVNTAPNVTANPVDATVCAGTNATFNVTATGAGLTYQWQISTDGGANYTNIASANASSYVVTGVTNAMNGYRYRVIINGTCPSAATSQGATLIVGNAASITGDPLSSVVCVGNNASFNVTASGSSLTYQWQVSTNGGSTYTDIPSATASTLSLNSVTASMNGYMYRAQVFSCTPTPLVSQAATLTVNTPVSIGTQPLSSVLCAGSNATFNVAATGTGVSYQWQISTNGGGTFTNIAGATTNTLAVNAVTAAQSGNQYHVVVTGACGPVTSSNVTLTVNSPVSITTQPVNAAICLPGTASFTIAATGTAVTQQWQVSTDGGTTWTNIAGQTGTTLNLTGITIGMNGYRYRAVFNGTCTSNLNSNGATLTVNEPVNITSQPVASQTCTDQTVTFSVTTEGLQSSYSYQWQVSVNGGPYVNVTNGGVYSGATTANLTITNPGVIMSGWVYRVAVTRTPCGTTNSNAVALTVNQKPTVVITAASFSTIDPSVPTGAYATVSPPGNYSFVWRKNGVVVPGVTGPSLPITVDDLGEYEATATNLSTGCSSISNRINFTDRASSMVFIYPNPSSGQFTVRFYNRTSSSPTSSTPITRTMNIYDSKGSRVYSKAYTTTGVYEAMDVDMDHAPSGVYLVELKDAGGKRLVTGKVVIRK